MSSFRVDSRSWIAYSRPNPQAKARLFCFPYAGAGISAFAAWSADLPAEVEVASVQLPGRESRISEAPYTRLSSLITDLADVIAPHLTKSFAFFGHSMGSLIGFELARELRRQGRMGPTHLFASGHRAPHLPERTRPIHALPEDEFVRELQLLNGTPEIVFKHAALMQLVLPLLRADLEMCETYRYRPEAPLDCSLMAISGVDDPRVSYQEVAAWRQHSRGSFALQMFAGDHFFLQQARKELLAMIANELR